MVNYLKQSEGIGKGLISAFILYSCINGEETGYSLMGKGKTILLTNWSTGSFYPIINYLMENKLIERKKTDTKRTTYTYKTTKKGLNELNRISEYFKNEEVKKFFNSMIKGGF